MSFEQLRGDKDVDVRTDVYAFGVMLYEALSGQPPYAAASLSELAIKVATTDAAPIKTLRPDVPTALCAIVDRAIRRRRDERWPDIASLMEQLAPFASERGLREQMTFQDMTAPRVATAKPPALPARSATPWGPTAHAAHTAAMPDTLRHTLDAPPVLSIAPPKQQLPASDSLMAHELAGASRQSASQQSVWLAAAAALAVTGIAAFFLLTPTTPPAPSPQSAVKQAPEHLAVPAPAPSPAPTLQFVPAQPEPTAPSPDSPPPAAPSGSADVAPSAFTPAAQSRTPKRKSSARNEPTRRAEAQRPQLGKTPATESAPSTKPEPRAKSADDMLGF
jgi:serine/threonine-protein kinase